MSKLKWWWGWIIWQPKRLGWAYVRWMTGLGADGNVLFYGARGNGQSNDSYALQDALKTGCMYCPPGRTFPVHHTLTIP